MKLSKSAAYAFALLAAASLPHSKAEEVKDLSKWYVTGSVGLSNPSDVESEKDNFSFNSNSVSTQYILEHDDGAEYTFGVGYYLAPDTRLELNYTNTNYDLNKAGIDGTLNSTQATVKIPANHDASVDSFILSINQDFPYSNGWKPFVGAGIGFSNVSVNDTTASLTALGNALGANLGTETILYGSDNTVFTYQLRGGVAKDVSKNADLFAEVSYTGTEGFSAGSGASKIDWKAVNNISIKAGARYRF